jgi:Styrene monooxygenase A putative substrate binding domain
MEPIGIVGGGLAGLHLALYLQKNGIGATLYAETTPDVQRKKRLPNTASHWRNTRERERYLAVNHWDGMTVPGHDEEFGNHCFHFYLGLPDGALIFRGDHQAPGITVDQRLITSTLLEDFENRGGQVVVGPVQAEDLDGLTTRHDFVVLSAGRGNLTEIFPRLPEHCPFTQPQRLICTGLYHGISYPDPVGVGLNAVPGVGELFEMPFFTFEGMKMALLFELVPGGPGEVLMETRPEEDQKTFEQNVLGFLREFMPKPLERLDPNEFGILSPSDVLQGAITPTVRRPYAQLDNGRWVMAIGDLHCVNDPLLGQGSNAASQAAFIMGEAIVRDGLAYDERFCHGTAERLWQYAGDVTAWNNYFLQSFQIPPGPAVVQFLLAAAENKTVADIFSDQFADPQANWNIFASFERTRTFLQRHGCATPILDQVLSAPR